MKCKAFGNFSGLYFKNFLEFRRKKKTKKKNKIKKKKNKVSAGYQMESWILFSILIPNAKNKNKTNKRLAFLAKTSLTVVRGRSIVFEHPTFSVYNVSIDQNSCSENIPLTCTSFLCFSGSLTNQKKD